MDVAHDKGNQSLDVFSFARAMFAAGARVGQKAFKAENPEMSPACGEICFGDLVDADVAHGYILQGRDKGIRDSGTRD